MSKIRRSNSVTETDFKEATAKLEKIKCSELWLRKMLTAFNLLDIDKSGRYKKQILTDLLDKAKAITKASDEDILAYHAHLDEWWQEVWKDETEIPWDLYIKAGSIVNQHPELKEVVDKQLEVIYSKFFQFIDFDGDGWIQRNEWQLYCQILSIDKEAANAGFDRMDTNKDGVLSVHEFAQAQINFFTDGGDNKYDYIYGPLADLSDDVAAIMA